MLPSTPPDSRQVQTLMDAVEAAQTADDLTDAVERLAACPHPMAIPCLIEVLGFNNPGAAVAAVDGLVAIGAPAVPAILANLDEYNYGARAWSVRALAGIGDLRGLPLLERALAQDIGPSVRRAAARGMGGLQPHGFTAPQRQALAERILPQLAAACRDEEWIVRYAVAVGLEGMEHWWQPPAAQRQRLLDTLQPLADPKREPAPVVRLRARLALNRLAATPPATAA